MGQAGELGAEKVKHSSEGELDIGPALWQGSGLEVRTNLWSLEEDDSFNGPSSQHQIKFYSSNK